MNSSAINVSIILFFAIVEIIFCRKLFKLLLILIWSLKFFHVFLTNELVL